MLGNNKNIFQKKSSSFELIESVNGRLTLFLFDEEGLIYSSADNKLHLLNGLGMYVWLLFEDGFSKQEVFSTCSTQVSTQSAEFNDLVDELHILFSNGELPCKVDDEEEIWLKEVPQHNDDLGRLGSYYKILDSIIAISYCDIFSKKAIEPLLSVFSHVGVEVCNYKIYIKKLGKDYLISINGYDFSWRIPKQQLAAFFNDRVRKLVFTPSDYFLASHAAVLAKGDKCLMMPAVSYSGKSTLSAALLSADYQYFSDEMAVIDRDYQARPVPLGIGLKHGSWHLLASYLPQLADLEEQQRWDGIPLKYVPIDHSIRHGKDRKKVSHLVFPTYRLESTAQLLPISTPQAVSQLFKAGFTMQGPFSKKQVIELLSWVESIPAYKFEFSQLDEAIDCLDVL